MKLIQKYFTELSDEQLLQFSKLEELYVDWNEKINVISRKDIENFYERHVLHSLAIAKIINFRSGTEILDVGTGGGFPGIPLAILFPATSFLLVDSIGKKIKVVNGVIESLGLKNARGKHTNSKDVKEQFDFVISRAVTSFSKFMPLVKGRFKQKQINSLQNGIIYLKGGDLSEELRDYKMDAVLHPLSDYFKEEFFETKYVVYFPV